MLQFSHLAESCQACPLKPLRTFTVKAILLLSMLLASPAQAQDLRSSAARFCDAALEINAKNVSVAPGSPGGAIIARNASQSPEQYRSLWSIAKALDIWACERMW
jgi:hypothetical protein